MSIAHYCDRCGKRIRGSAADLPSLKWRDTDLGETTEWELCAGCAQSFVAWRTRAEAHRREAS